ncbi:FAD-dependent monooxygenase [Collimonas pratensis]|uniref:FAD-dependent monooxygenase n=1 Tax=Collimonas pratensis TaxID=279113 RepID=UPI0007819E65|nr:FAD-dependent monooxygenase [Collimonas pratensis]
METPVDVVIVGAGPVGLLTAIELTLGGARVLVLERLTEVNMAMKAMSIGPLGCEALKRRGMAAAIAAAEANTFAAMDEFTKQTGAQLRGRASKYSGHFGGLSLIRKDAQKDPERRPRLVRQHELEAMLADRAHALGIEVRRECELTSFEQRVDGVDLEWASPTDRGRITCSYLIGCDGGRSLIRKMAGFDFPGTAPTSTFYQVIAQIDHPERLLPIGWNRTSGGVFAYGPVPGRLFMLDFIGTPEDRQAPVTCEETEAVLRRVSGADIRVKVLESGSRWTDNTRLADSYRKGRVLLAGDAAHVHSPFGGQGLNLGLADAANLGWKLAAVIRGEMPDSLLDTYTAERRPVAKAVLANTLAQIAILRPDPQSGAMRDIVAHLMEFDDVNRFIGEMMSGVSSRYDFGSELDQVGRLLGDQPISHGDAGGSLYDLMQDGMGVLLDASGDGEASRLVAAATQRIRCVAVDSGPSMLIRPDACVAWVSQESSMDGLEEALRCWFKPAADDC